MKYYKIFFPILVLCMLLVPLFHINMADVTEQENRTLAKFPEMEKKGTINSNYGKEFENWLGDRFWGRNELIDARFQVTYKINGRIENEKAFIGDDGWMFEKSKTLNIPSIESQRKKIEKDVRILKKFVDKFKDKNIPIYLVIVPDREQLYQKYWERYYKPKPQLDYGEEMIEFLKDQSNIKIIYPKDEFFRADRKEELFFKDDGHLTYIGSKLLLEYFLRATKYGYSEELKIVPYRDDHHYLSDVLGIKSSDEEHEGNGVVVKSLKNIEPKIVFKNDGGSSWPLYVNYSSQNAIYHNNLYIFGICYGYNTILPYLSHLFENSHYLRLGPHYRSYNETNERDFYFQQILPKIHSGDIIVLLTDNVNPLSEVVEN